MKPYTTAEDYMLASLEHFAGMNLEEIRNYLKFLEEIEKSRWEKEWAAKQLAERAEEEAYLATEESKQHILSPYEVDLEYVTAIDPLPVVNGKIYVSQKDMSRGQTFLRFYIAEQKNGGVIYLPVSRQQISRR